MARYHKARVYYVRHVPECAQFTKNRTRTFKLQSEADYFAVENCTSNECRSRVTPIVMLVSDPYFEEVQ